MVTVTGDLEAGLQQKTVLLVEKKSSTGWMGKLFMAMLLAVLCCGGAMLLVSYWNGRQEKQAVPGETEALTERKNTDPQYTLSGLSSKAKAAIHLEGSFDEGEVGQQQLEWKNGQGQAFAQGGLRLDNNSIIIPKTGLYFVYSQASFQVSCSNGDKEASEKVLKPLSHRVWCRSESVGNKATLLSAVRSACQNLAPEGGYSEGQNWYNAIYLGAVFKLQKGDTLWTETNQLSELDTNEGKTFFGVFGL